MWIYFLIFFQLCCASESERAGEFERERVLSGPARDFVMRPLGPQERLREDYFSGLMYLRLVSMRNCRITFIPPLFFSFLPYLQKLDVSGNAISQFPKLILPELINFNAARNNISIIPSDAFLRTPRLLFVDLRNNGIVAIGHGAFSGMQLRRVNLSQNDDLIFDRVSATADANGNSETMVQFDVPSIEEEPDADDDDVLLVGR